MKTFLKPLTPEEEKYYLQEYKQGSLEAKDILIQRNLRLVAHIVKKYQGAGEELDDDQNGVKRYVVEIFGDNMEMLSSPRQSQQAPQSAPAQPSGAQPVQQGSAAQSAPAGEMSDDLPF